VLIPANVNATRKSAPPFRQRALLLALILLLCAAPAVLAEGWKLKDKDGVSYALSGLKGKWVLVNFWAPWCPICIDEMPEFNALQKQHQDLQIIGVAVMYQKKQEVMDVIRAQSISYPVVLGNEDIASEFGEMKGMPTSFLYAPSGKLVGQHDGPLTQHEIEQAIAQAPEAAGLFIR
jgi:thiol-disulfide isomerase/thioredoxin